MKVVDAPLLYFERILVIYRYDHIDDQKRGINATETHTGRSTSAA